MGSLKRGGDYTGARMAIDEPNNQLIWGRILTNENRDIEIPGTQLCPGAFEALLTLVTENLEKQHVDIELQNTCRD